MSEELEFRRRLAEHERQFLRPARGDLDELAAAINYRGSDPGAAVWERAIHAGRIPANWADDPQRRFRATHAERLAAEGRERDVGNLPTPATARAALLFASDPEGLLAAERHARQLISRFEVWGCPPATNVVWRLAGSPVAPKRARPRSFGRLAPALARLHAELGASQRIYEPPHSHRGFQVVVDALHGSRRLQLLLGDLPNPFEAWLALASTGYGLWTVGVDARGVATIELAAPFPPPSVPPCSRERERERDRGRVVWSRRLRGLRLACARGDLNTLRRKLPLLPGEDQPGRPRLIHFASYGGPEVLTLLAEHLADLDLEARDVLDRTPLMLAAGLPTEGPAGAEEAELGVPISENVGVEACAWLLAAGADREAKDRQGWTALHWAARACRQRCAVVLIEAGAKPNASDHRGRTPLMLALHSEPMVELLLSAGADADQRDHHGWTALHYLAAYTYGRGVRGLARRLVEAGARPSRDRAGRSPAQLCALQGVVHTDAGPFDPRSAVAAGPGAPTRALDPLLVERLLDQLVTEQPSRADDWMVWADWLQSRGDPRGELVATSLAHTRLGQRKQRRMANELAQLEHAAAAMTRVGLDCADPLAPIRPSPIRLTCTHGFVTAARISSAGWELPERARGSDPSSPYAAVREQLVEAAYMLLKHEPLLAELRLDLDGRDAWARPLVRLRELETPSRLRALVLGGMPLQLPELDLLQSSFPALRSLSLIGASKIHSGALRWPGITHLRIRHGTTDQWAQGGVELSLALPDLEHLDLALPAASQDNAAEIDGAARTLSGIKQLDHLRLRPLTGDFAAAILVCGLLPRLRTLELANVDASALGLLLHHAEPLRGLERICVSCSAGLVHQHRALLDQIRRALPRLELSGS